MGIPAFTEDLVASWHLTCSVALPLHDFRLVVQIPVVGSDRLLNQLLEVFGSIVLIQLI